MTSSDELHQAPVHSILSQSWQFTIIGLQLEKAPSDGGEPYLELTLLRGTERRLLRFWSPCELEIERGGPTMTSGLVIYDVRSRGLEGIGVRVDDFEASPGAVRFFASTVEEVSPHRT